eukprot:5184489-Pyramimonas_sp.AAC.1
MAGGFQLPCARSREWRLQCPLHAAKGDVQGAIDKIAFDLMIDAMRHRRLHPQLMAAISREQLFTVVEPVFQGIKTQGAIPFNKSGKQGGVET